MAYHSGFTGLAPIALPSGAAAAPVFAFSSETSLGWYRSNNSEMGLSYGTLNLPGNCAIPQASYYKLGTAASVGQGAIRMGGVPLAVEASLADGSAYTGFRAGMFYAAIAGSATAPEYASSETSLGWYKSAASTMALSYGTLSLTGGVILSSIRTTSASGTSATVNDKELRIVAVSVSSAQLAFRSGNTTYLINADAVAL